jgi:hypothetical protein
MPIKRQYTYSLLLPSKIFNLFSISTKNHSAMMLYGELDNPILLLLLVSRLFGSLVDNFMPRIQLFQLGPARGVGGYKSKAEERHGKSYLD